ncbi:MAG: type II secretion system F family protein [Acidobacteria bacterium]|nr:MAG: type II secretion system F family protein [Acidobacteriota bacterium]
MQFVCRLGTADGRIVTELQQGSDVGAVRRELERKGFHVFEVKPRGFGLLRQLRWPGRRRRRLPAREFLAFNQELAALLRAGLPLLQSLDLMLERMEDENFREILSEVRDQVKSGAELSEAFASFGDLFPPLYPSTLKAGERSGELEQVLRRFIRYLRLVLGARKKVFSALIYPTVLISLSVVMMLVMAVVVVPRFSRFYDDLDAELPALTQTTLSISFFLRDHFLWIVAGAVAGIWALRRWAGTEGGRVVVDRWRLEVPLVGDIFRYFSLSEFCRSLSTLLAGGIPLLQALDTAVSAVSNAFVRRRLEPAIAAVREGQAFHRAVEDSGIFPPLGIDMIKVGEATGALDDMLASISDHFDEAVETRTERLLALFEPIMLVVMGVIVAALLVSIYLPMVSILGQVGS